MLELTYKRILLLALPLMFGTFVQSLITITDGAFVSELGNTAYNAVGNGSLMYFALFMLCRGLGDGAQISIAKLYGEQKESEIGKILLNAQFIQLILTTIIFISFISFADSFIQATSDSKKLGAAITEFIHYRSWGIFFAGLQVTMAAFFIGLGRTRIIIFSTLLMGMCNIFLDYSLIFGNFGFPELGMKGAPIASSISEMITFFFMLIYALKAKSFKKFAFTLKQKIDLKIIKPLINLSYPLMFQGMLSLSTWWLFFGLIEHMGSDNLEIAHNIRYMYFIAFIPIFGFGAATKTYVSNLVGRGQEHLIPKIQWKITILSMICLILLFHGAYFYPNILIQIVEHNPNASSELLNKSAEALRFVSGSILLFSIVIVPFHSISALGNTKHTFMIELFSIALYLIMSYLVIEVWHWNIVQVWWVEYTYFGSLGLISVFYLQKYHRKRRGSREKEIQ
jgi:MATE family, multidrug efflux pump